ncbi:S-adenosyl-L-methionine-dependent methyltransferase [Aspergillus parasiticus]|uniref:S-adenosyl-L-methionine-dependent methyltransferase n=1 Tax=Aspergillus parasiticus TaxID=5067 RepID=A0A5N6DXF9_ASPPA|nr:S-adenosyl-L-methionine-dependent methyltransferase [Aspergillus parasiticus]
MDLAKLAAAISEAAEFLSGDPENDLPERAELLRACENLAASIELPGSKLEKASVGMTPMVAARIAIDLGIFDLVHSTPKDEFTNDDFISHTGADPLLLCRTLRSLTATGVFTVTQTGTYKPDPVPLKAHGADATRTFSDLHFQIFGKLPQYLRETQYKSPADAYAGPFQYAFDTDEHFFDWIKSRPAQLDAFNRTMQAGVVRDNAARWTNIFPVAQRLQRFLRADLPPDEKFQMVDIGGGVGHEIKILLDTLPGLAGHFILQDVPGVIESILPELRTTPASLQTVQAMPYNFFEPQPVTHAHVYFLGRVLHDWPDTQARSILQHVRNAMGKDSLLLIHERVLPDGPSKVHPSDAIMDFNMMALCSSLERTETQFRDLLAAVGLDLVRVWWPAAAGLHRQAVLEAVRAGSPNEG